MKRYGFTLFRLFLLLALVGLVSGGAILKQSMERSAELRGLLAGKEQILTAVGQFRSRYGQLPGDYAQATSVWGRDAAHCLVYEDMPPDTNPVSANGVCNGDGDGLVESTAMMPTTPSEFFQFWRHLARAGLIEGQFTGLTGSNYAQCIPGENCPQIGNGTAIPTEFNWEGTGSNGWWGTGTVGHGNWLVLGAPTDGLSWPFVPLLTAKEQSDLDTKTDDGKPASGTLMAMGCQLYQSGCMADAQGAKPTVDCDGFAKVAEYQRRTPGITCTPMWRMTELAEAPIHD